MWHSSWSVRFNPALIHTIITSKSGICSFPCPLTESKPMNQNVHADRKDLSWTRHSWSGWGNHQMAEGKKQFPQLQKKANQKCEFAHYFLIMLTVIMIVFMNRNRRLISFQLSCTCSTEMYGEWGILAEGECWQCAQLKTAAWFYFWLILLCNISLCSTTLLA